ncbi:MAG: proline--tRNA ligase [Candidatus Omnitrophica bacterium]|nr:proline--tRNA ligase [Candidatus Omnitrophota bacterium]
MLFSESFIFTAREDPKTADCTSHKLLLKGCFLYMVSSGIYSYLPLGHRVLENVSNIIRKHMNACGAQEILMSALQPIEMWQKTGRDKDLEEVMFKFKDRKNRDLCLGPTHEEEITEIVAKFLTSYKQLPFTLYQIQAKFRDEPRPRFGLMRSAEFIMKDAYSFDIDEEGLALNYEKMLGAYKKIFTECGLEFVEVKADSGVMGGDVSHEFMVAAAIGEDELFYCDKCKQYFKESGKCCNCKLDLKEVKTVEIGHVFKLGAKYSKVGGAMFLDNKGKSQPVIMGCYGIGVSRILPAIVQTNHDDKGIIWPKGISPFDVSILILSDGAKENAIEISGTLEDLGISTLVDDRPLSAGVKFNDAYLIGNPFVVVVGKNFINSGKLDIEVRKTKEKLCFTKDEAIDFLKKEYGK